MFEKWTKHFASKATDAGIEGVKETLNDKIDQYGDIIKMGLVLSVVIFGGRHLTKQYNYYSNMPMQQPYGLPSSGRPIVINNYYQEKHKGGYSYGYQPENYSSRRQHSYDKYTYRNSPVSQTGTNQKKR
jgi:hypothetical protein